MLDSHDVGKGLLNDFTGLEIKFLCLNPAVFSLFILLLLCFSHLSLSPLWDKIRIKNLISPINAFKPTPAKLLQWKTPTTGD